jgi:hypothetical protein
MEDNIQAKILQLLDVISVEVAANRNQTTQLGEEMRSEFASVRHEMRGGFDRVDRRLGNLEDRVETLETEVRDFRGEFERRIAQLEH